MKNRSNVGYKAARIFLAAGAAVLIFTGCKGKPTAVDIMKEAVKNTNKAESFSGKMVLDAGIGMKESGMSLGLDMNMDMDIEAVKKTGACHLKGGVKTGLTDMQVNMEVFNVPGEDESGFVTYMNVADTWTKAKSTAMDEKKNIAALMNLESYIKNGSRLELEKDTRKEEGGEVYVIKTSAGGSGLGSAGAILGRLFGNSGDGFDLKDVEMNVIFKIYKETMLPESVSMTLTGGEGAGLVIPVPGNALNEVSLKNISFLLSFQEFDTVGEIRVPEEALGAQSDPTGIMSGLEEEVPEEEVSGEEDLEENVAEEPELQKDSEGNYILTDWENKKKIAIPAREGMEVDQYSTNTNITFYKDGDQSYSASYSLETLYEKDDEEFYAGFKESAKETYETIDGYSDIEYHEKKEIKSGDRTIKYVSLSYTYEDTLYENEVYAWTIIDDGSLLACDIREHPEKKGDYAIDESVIKELFDGIK